MMYRLSQVFMGAGLMGLLAVPAMTKTPTATADPQSDVTVFQPSDAATCSDRCLTQLSLDRSPAIEAIAFLDMHEFTDLWTRISLRN